MKTKKITFCGISAALATVIMIAAYFPYVTYAVPCVASLVIMAVVIELGNKYAFLTYLVSALPVFLFCEIESKLLYICFLGFYPVLKAIFEKIKILSLEILLKFVSFNSAIAVVYLFSTFVLGIPFDDMGELGQYGGIILIVLANVTFLLYDVCISKMSLFYMIRIHPSVRKMLK